MKLVSEFSVPARPEEVFPLFFDADTMRACIPGCEELERLDENTYRGRLVNEIAHVRFSAGFSAAIESVTDAGEVRAVLKGEDRRLGSSIKIDARLTVRPDGGASVVGYEMDMALWGKLGRLGEPIVRRRSREVELEFVKALTAACTAPAVVEEVPVSGAATAPPTMASPAATPAGGSRTATFRRAALAAAVIALVAVIATRRQGR
jgi:carbon monoxide dehydrogenase subunit G